jgi:ethanolamine ammonia-lyase small subunit
VDRATYLQRPDLGRRLDQESADRLAGLAAEPAEVVVIIADGLSATAAQRHAAELVTKLLDALQQRHWRVGPLCAVQQARVAIEDEIGWLLKAKIAVILIGERPGLGSADSLGAYLVHDPVIGRTDAQRNCISNIHPNHLTADAATTTLVWLIEQAMVRQLSGVELKDESSPGTALDGQGVARL